MGLARNCTNVLFSVLEARVASAASFASEAYCLVCEGSIRLDHVDREVVRDALAVATRLLSRLFAAMREDLDGDDAKELAGVGEIASRYRVRLDSDYRATRVYTGELISLAMERATKARRFIRRFDRRKESTVDAALSTSIRRLEIALHVLGAERAEAPLENDVAAYRQLMRRRLGGDGTTV